MTLLSIIIVLASILLIFVVFVQNPKGGGLSSDFGAASQLGGVQKTNDFIDKATWSLAGIIGICSIFMTIYLKPAQVEKAPEATATETPSDSGTTSEDGK